MMRCDKIILRNSARDKQIDILCQHKQMFASFSSSPFDNSLHSVPKQLPATYSQKFDL